MTELDKMSDEEFIEAFGQKAFDKIKEEEKQNLLTSKSIWDFAFHMGFKKATKVASYEIGEKHELIRKLNAFHKTDIPGTFIPFEELFKYIIVKDLK